MEKVEVPRLSDNALAILEKRYFRKDPDGNIVEDWHGLCTRVASFIARAEEEDRDSWAAEFYYMMYQLKFLPNSPTLFNADMPLGNLSACFVLPVEDSLEGIFDSLKNAAIIFASGGGCGYDFSELRKRGSRVSRTSGVSSGPVSFIHVFNSATEIIKQGGKRRGANMGVLGVDHPDIVEFIDAKMEEGALANFNLSVAITDEFMEAVQGDGSFPLFDGYLEKVDRIVRARDLFDKIVERTWTNGEPGVIFIDRINEKNPLPDLGNIAGVNPCISRGTLIPTNRGLVPIETVREGDQVLTRDGKFSTVLKQTDNGAKPVVELTTRRGFRVKVTSDHKMWTPEGWVSADQCLGALLVLQRSEAFGTQGMGEDLAELLGFWFGDGSVGERVQFAFGHDEFLAQRYRDILNSQFECKVNISTSRGRNKVPSLKVVTGKRSAVEFFTRYKHKETIPGEILEGTRETQASFLRGLFAADGHIEKAGGMRAIALACVNEDIIDQVMLMLLNFGIVCSKYRSEEGPVPDNVYGFKGTVCYRLQFAGQFREIFANEIGIYKEVPFTKTYHLNDETDAVVSIDDAGECKVYDLTVGDETHSFIAGGVAVSNCSEEPLLPNESCNLGSINLTHFYKEKKGEHKFESVDWEALADIVSKAVRFLDDVISMNRYPVKDIETASQRTRKTGLGVMGWADLLLMLQIGYDSDEAVELAALMMEWIQYHALKASVELAKKRGKFPAFDCYMLPDRAASKWTRDKVNWDELDTDIQEFGLRNACVSTVAPTGSLSLIAGVSSGIEPNFQWMYEYYRVDQKFSEKHWIASLFLDKGVPLPEYFVTALDIAPIWHIKMQAAWQKWIDAGISKTINLPFEATREDVREAILEAWRMRCKGITLYRSGSREKEVLVAKGKEQPKVSETAGVSPRKRPMFTYGSTVKIPVGADCGTMFVTVNSDEFGPCESFVMLGRGGGCISSYAEALGRMISLALRSGVDVKEIVDQLSGIRCSRIRWMEGRTVHSCPDAVAYALERVLLSEDPGVLTKEDLERAFDDLARHKVPPTPEDLMEADAQSRRDYVRLRSIIESGENPVCPECHEMLTIEGRCVLCRACGYTRCS